MVKSRVSTAKPEELTPLGAMMEQALADLDATREWLALRIGVPGKTLDNWFTRTTPGAADLTNVIEALGLDPEAACAATGVDLRKVLAIIELHRTASLPHTIDHARSLIGTLPVVEGREPPIITLNMSGRPQDTESELKSLLGLIVGVEKKGNTQVLELQRVKALALHWLVSVMRETRLAPELDSSCRFYIRNLLNTGRRLGDEAFVARAFLDDAHNAYVTADSGAALTLFGHGLSGERREKITPDELMLALRTQALARAYHVRDQRAPRRRNARDTRQILAHLDEIEHLTTEVRRMAENGNYNSRHNAMTSLEGVARACGVVGLHDLFDLVMDEAEAMDRALADRNVVYPLPRIQRIYARLSVYTTWPSRDDDRDFEALVSKGRAVCSPERYPRHRAQIEAVARAHLNR